MSGWFRSSRPSGSWVHPFGTPVHVTRRSVLSAHMDSGDPGADLVTEQVGDLPSLVETTTADAGDSNRSVKAPVQTDSSFWIHLDLDGSRLFQCFFLSYVYLKR